MVAGVAESELSLGWLIRRIRLSTGDSQRKFADKLGVDPAYISYLERDERDPSVKLLRRIAAISAVPVSLLLVTALWAELDEREKNAFRPMLASLGRIATRTGQS